MSMNELNTTAHDLMSVRAMIEELEAEAQALTDKLKAVMVEQGDGSPPGGRLESHLEERGQQPVRLQAVQSRPLRPVQPPDHHHPLSSQRMRRAPHPTSRPKRLNVKPVTHEGV